MINTEKQIEGDTCLSCLNELPNGRLWTIPGAFRQGLERYSNRDV